MGGLYLAPDADLKTWAILVSGYGTVIEASLELALLQAKHFEDRGHQVRIVPMEPAPAEPEKPKLLQWNELTPGDYWAFPVSAADEAYDENEGSQFVMVSEWKGSLSIDGESESGDLDESWGSYQFLPYVRTARAQVEFQPENLTPSGAFYDEEL